MEFPSRKHCVAHFQELYPNLPQYMIELALDYDLNRVKPTGAQKRALKRNTKNRETQCSSFDPDTAVQVITPSDTASIVEGTIEVENKSVSIIEDDGSLEECR